MQTTLELSWEGQAAGRLVFEGPECWRFHARPDVQVIPRWSGLVRDGKRHGNARAWCRHLLPDADGRSRLAQALGLSPGNDFALLALRGGDCRGAVSFTGETQPVRETADWRALSAAERSALAADRGALLPVALSLLPGLLPGPPGHLPCRPAQTDDGVLVGGASPSHVVSAGRTGCEESLENELLCTRLAAALDLPVPAVRVLDGAPPLLLSARHDRETGPSGEVRPRHVESLCQIAGLHPEFAFEREGGLSLRHCVRILRRFSAAPALDLRALLRWAVYCFMVGIGQGHAGTLLLVVGPEGPRLAIDGGLFATHVYPGQSDRLAVAIGGEDRPDWLRLARWLELADELAIGRRYMLDMLESLAGSLPRSAEDLVAASPLLARSRTVAPRMLRLIANRARQTQIALAAERR